MSGVIINPGGRPSQDGRRARANAVEWLQDFKYTGLDSASDRLGWPVDHLGTPDFDWADGDGLTPEEGPALTASGSPTAGVATPWTGRDGQAITCTAFAGGEHYKYTATGFDPGSGEDMVILALVWSWPSGTLNAYLSTRDTGVGWMLYRLADGTVRFTAQDSGGSVTSQGQIQLGWNVLGITYDADEKQYLYVNGALADSDTVSGLGSLASGLGIAVNARPQGDYDEPSMIARGMAWYGSGLAGLAPAAWHKRVAAYVLGYQNLQGDDQPTFTRASAAVKKVGTRYHVFGSGAARAGSSEGLLIEGAGTNKCYNTINPQATTGWSVTGGTHTVVDDSASLGANLREAGPNVHQFANSDGVDRYIYGGAATGNTNKHSASVFARLTAGAGAELGVRDASGGGFTKWADISDSYALTKIANQTPGDTDEQFCIKVPDGCTIRFILPQIEESTICTSPIPNVATAATATRAADVLDTTITPRDAEGAIEAGLTPYQWSGTEPGADAQIVTRDGGAASLIRYESSGSGSYASEDGTNTANPAVAPADGTRRLARVRWGNAGLSLDVAGTRDSQSYDGALAASGVVRLGAGVPVYLDSMRIYRHGGER